MRTTHILFLRKSLLLPKPLIENSLWYLFTRSQKKEKIRQISCYPTYRLEHPEHLRWLKVRAGTVTRLPAPLLATSTFRADARLFLKRPARAQPCFHCIPMQKHPPRAWHQCIPVLVLRQVKGLRRSVLPLAGRLINLLHWLTPTMLV